ncbi:MAG: DUF5672 family protein [Cytophagaceae bacterium]
MVSNVAIVIPIYKSSLTKEEKCSLAQARNIFSSRKIYLVYPDGLAVTNYSEIIPNVNLITFDSYYFRSVQSYSLLLNSPFFYQSFLQHDYILIYQLDAYVFKDELDVWCQKGYDYVGAPWIEADWIKKLGLLGKLVYPVGNGGFSLRKVKSFYQGAQRLQLVVKYLWRKKWNEDFFWSSLAKRVLPGFRIPEINEALGFAFEEKPSKCFQLNGNQLPMGCHAWEKYEPEFWREYIPCASE